MYWFNLDWTLVQVHKYIYSQYAHLLKVEEGQEDEMYDNLFKQFLEEND
jgi:hypothetical protein